MRPRLQQSSRRESKCSSEGYVGEGYFSEGCSEVHLHIMSSGQGSTHFLAAVPILGFRGGMVGTPGLNDIAVRQLDEADGLDQRRAACGASAPSPQARARPSPPLLRMHSRLAGRRTHFTIERQPAYRKGTADADSRCNHAQLSMISQIWLRRSLADTVRTHMTDQAVSPIVGGGGERHGFGDADGCRLPVRYQVCLET
jgi:hypothetical protein